jgi:hypothetical protein
MRSVSEKICRENQKTFFFLRNWCLLWDSMEKYCRVRQAIDYNIISACALLVQYLRLQTLTMINTNAVPRQQWLGMSTSMLRLNRRNLSCNSLQSAMSSTDMTESQFCEMGITLAFRAMKWCVAVEFREISTMGFFTFFLGGGGVGGRGWQ